MSTSPQDAHMRIHSIITVLYKLPNITIGNLRSQLYQLESLTITDEDLKRELQTLMNKGWVLSQQSPVSEFMIFYQLSTDGRIYAEQNHLDYL